MRKGRELIHLPVISVATGESLGEVKDLILDPRHNYLVALVVGGSGTTQENRILPIDPSVALGPDAVTVPTPDALRPEQEMPQEGWAMRTEGLTGTRVVTAGGRELGTVGDVIFQGSPPMLTGWELSDGLLKDLVAGRTNIPLTSVLTWGRDAVIVTDEGETFQGEQEKGDGV